MKIKKLIPQELKNYYHLAQAVLANSLFGFPSRKIKVIGVTGTNGKTTTCQMIAKVLEEAGNKIALASTINFKIGKEEWVNATKFTTLSSFKVQSFIYRAVKEKCEYLILETSSHSLDQNRVWGVEFYAGVITNITREHLDYHKTMEEYREAKIKLFNNVRTAVINLDLENPEGFINERMDKACGYSANQNQKKAEFMSFIAENAKLNANGSEFHLNDQSFKLNIPGKFNIENALAAVCFGATEGIKMKVIAEALEKIKLIPGRMEYVPNNIGLNIIIDYAVTPDSLEKLYFLIDAMRKSKNHPEQSEGSQSNNDHSRSSGFFTHAQNDNKIIAVFGACGERDRGKRPIMGEIVSKYADYIILTNEDPYNEDPWRIINEVAKGIKNKKENTNLWKILDRREAIKKAVQISKSGDYIIITGKGAEETMAVGKEIIPWNDKRVILEELDKIKHS